MVEGAAHALSAAVAVAAVFAVASIDAAAGLRDAATSAADPAPAAPADGLVARGRCRDGLPHGLYELRAKDGTLRATGAFNRGQRTSSFIFWSPRGVRVAHLPYDDGVRSGTVSLWYADGPRGRDPQVRLEAGYRRGRRDGESLSWFADGRPRAVFVYADGALIEARAWAGAGAPLPDADARKLAARDEAADERYYRLLEAIVDAHPPRCDAAPPPAPGKSAMSPAGRTKPAVMAAGIRGGGGVHDPNDPS